MSILLCTSGQSPFVVIEAFMLCRERPEAVYCLTTGDPAKAATEVLHEFFKKEKVLFRCSRVASFSDLRSSDDQCLLEEVLFRWYGELSATGKNLQVCLAGGFKTMSSTLQQAAEYFGAEALFHVVVNGAFPKSEFEVRAAMDEGQVFRIDLGPRDGWPLLRTLNGKDFALLTTSTTHDGDEIYVDVPDYSLGEFLKETGRTTQRLAKAVERLADHPFAGLALWRTDEQEWLQAPLDPESDREWVRALPKIELHCHLGGFATHGRLLDLVRGEASVPDTGWPPTPDRPELWPEPLQPCGLDAYMSMGDATGSCLLGDERCLVRHIQLLYRDLLDDGVVYAEIRCSPNNYTSDSRSAWDVLTIIRDTFQRCMEETVANSSSRTYCHINLIIIATRRAKGDYRASISRHLALAVTAAQHWEKLSQCRVVGVDLAGFENEETRAHYYRDEFTAAHRCGLAVTVHAGENDDAEAIWRAVYDLSARRLGHALELLSAPDLLRSIAERGVTVEMCPYANYQIKGYRPMDVNRDYPLQEYLNKGIAVTVNTDNRGISDASLTDNILFLAKLCPGLKRHDILRMLRFAIEGAFEKPNQKMEILRRVEKSLQRPCLSR